MLLNLSQINQALFWGPMCILLCIPGARLRNFVPQTANGGPFIPYQSIYVHPINGNSDVRPWGIPPHLSPHIVDIDNHEEQPRQTLVPVTIEVPDENEPGYRGPSTHVEIPSRVAQPTA